MPSLHDLPGATINFLVADAQGRFSEPPTTCIASTNNLSSHLVPVRTNQRFATSVNFNLQSMPRAYLFPGTHVSVTLRIDGTFLQPVIKSVGDIQAQNGTIFIDRFPDIASGSFVSPVFRSFATAVNAYLHPTTLGAWLATTGVIEVWVCHVTTRLRSHYHSVAHPSLLYPQHEPPAPPAGSTHFVVYERLGPDVPPVPLALEEDRTTVDSALFVFRYGDDSTLQDIARAHRVRLAGAQPAPTNAIGASGNAQNGNPSASASAPAPAPATVQRANSSNGLQVAQNGPPSASAPAPATVQRANSNAGLQVAPARPPQPSTHASVANKASTTSEGNVTGHGAADAVPLDRPGPSSEEQKPSHPSGSPKRISAQAAVAVEGDPTSSDGNLKRKASSSPARSIHETTKMVKRDEP